MIFNFILTLSIICLLISLFILYKAFVIVKKRTHFAIEIYKKNISTSLTLTEGQSVKIYETLINKETYNDNLIVLINAKTKDEVTTIREFPCIIGRDADIIILNNLTVSRRHAIFTLENNQFYIKDLESTNGTFVNGKKILSKHKIEKWDKIRIGDIEFLADVHC